MASLSSIWLRFSSHGGGVAKRSAVTLTSHKFAKLHDSMNKIFNRIVVAMFVAAVAASAVPITGCKKDQSATGETAQQAMGLYAKGFNELIAEPQEMVKEYFDKIPEDGPDETKNNKLFPRQNFASSKIDVATK